MFGAVRRRSVVGLLVPVVAINAAAVVGSPRPLRADDDLRGTWVWFGGTDDGPRYLRRSFDVPAKPTSALLRSTVDNTYVVFLNGERLGGDSQWESVDRHDVAGKLRVGRNVIAVEAANRGGGAGAFVRLDAVLADGSKLGVGTDGQTRASLVASDGWQAVDFDDSSWAFAAVLGDASMAPWSIGGSAGGPVALAAGLAQTSGFAKGLDKPVAAAEQKKHFRTPEGFEIELVAAEPLVINPVTIAVDERGRIYVSESHTYRYGPAGSPVKPYRNPIIRLEPRPDGSLERQLVADGFEDPVMGIAIRGGRLWATANDHLYEFTLPATGPATDRKLLIQDRNKAWNPFGMFVLEWAPDGLLAMSVGNHAIDLKGPDGTLSGRKASGIVMRMKPDGTSMELLTQGFRVPYSFEIDPFGQLWLLSNGEGSPNRFARIIEGVDYHCYTRGVDNTWLAGRHRYSAPAMELPGGAHTQLIRYHSSAYPERYQGSLFLDNWGRHGFTGGNRAVFRYATGPDDEITETEPFVSCADPHFRVSHIALEPDGTMLLADWYGRDDESDLTGRIWRVRYTGTDAPKVTESLDVPDWGSDAYAIRALGSANHAIREKAVERLVARGDAVVPLVRAHAEKAAEPIGAAMALWTLARIGTPDAFAAVSAGAAHADWKVRRLAANLVRRFDAAGREQVGERLAADANLAVRIAAARAVESPDRGRSMLAALAATPAVDDDHLRYELASLMARRLDPPTLRRLLASDDENVRHLAELVIDIASYEKVDGYEEAIQELRHRLATASPADLPAPLMLARLHGTPDMVPLLAGIAARVDVPPAIAAQAVLAIRAFAAVPPDLLAGVGTRFVEAVERGEVRMQSTGDWLLLFDLLEAEGPTPRTLGQIASRLGDGDATVRGRAHALTRSFGGRAKPLAGPLATVAAQSGIRPEIKADAIASLAAVESPPDLARWEIVLASNDAFVRREAVRWWRVFRNTPAQSEAAAVLVRRAPQLIGADAEIRGDLAAVLRDLAAPPDDIAAIAAPGSVSDKDAIAETTLAAVAKSSGQAKTLAALAGRGVFERAGCTKCHTTAVTASDRAPSLKGIGSAQKPPYLVEAILHPSAILKTGFETELVETKDGRVFSGLVKEQGDSLRVLTADAEKILPKAEVENRSVQRVSLMPEGQEKLMSSAELIDLVEYLVSLR